MDTTEPTTDSLDERQSLQVITEMIARSQRKLKNDGILFILWGWVKCLVSVEGYIIATSALTFTLRNALNYLGYALGIFAIGYTAYYILIKRKKAQTYIGISLRYVWISLLVGLSLINMIQFHVLHQINFSLQHPVFMVLIAFATVVTGVILRYRLIIIGGVLFGVLAYACSFFELHHQILIEAFAWFIAFVIPGHILYSKREK